MTHPGTAAQVACLPGKGAECAVGEPPKPVGPHFFCAGPPLQPAAQTRRLPSRGPGRKDAAGRQRTR